MNTLLWLDDQRDPNSLTWRTKYKHVFERNSNVVWAKTYEEFVSWISKNGLPNAIAYDHDLGEGKSGYDAAKWLTRYCDNHKIDLPEWIIQSSNPVGKENINAILFGYKKYLYS